MFAESMRQEFTTRHPRAAVRAATARRFEGVEKLASEDIADAVSWIVTRNRRVADNEVLIRPTEQQG